MTWVKLSDTFADDPKLEDAGADALAVHVAALCFCSRQLTDGHIPRRTALRLWSVDDPSKAVAELIRVGLWTETDDGYEIVDYLEDQPSSEEVRHKQKLKAERMRKWREGKKRKGVDALRDGARDGARDPYPAPPRPAPKGGERVGRPDGSASAAPLPPPPGGRTPLPGTRITIVEGDHR